MNWLGKASVLAVIATGMAVATIVRSGLYGHETDKLKMGIQEWKERDPQSVSAPRTQSRVRNNPVRQLQEIPEGYFNYTDVFAKFTDVLPIFENPDAYWSGEWTSKPSSDGQGQFLKGFSNTTGKVDIYFEYIPRIRKHIAMLKVMDGPYADSRRNLLIVNLKMSTFDESNSTFTMQKPINTEHHAMAQLFTEKLEKQTIEYFDLDFELKVLHPSGLPVANLTKFTNYKDSKLALKVTSKMLGVSLDISAASIPRPRPSTWISIILPILIFGALVTSFSCMVILTDGRGMSALINNNGFEIYGLFGLFYFHHFLIFLTMATKLENYKTTYYVTSTFFLLKSFMTMIVFFIAIASDNGLMRRGERPKLYYFGSVVLFCLLVILQAILVPGYTFSKNYTYLLAAFYLYPIAQLFITWYRRKGKKVFDFKYQGIIWGVVSVVGILQRGIYNPFMDLEPNKRVAIMAIAVPVAVATLMYFMNKYGLYFCLPEFLTPETIDYKMPVGRFSQEKLDDFCCICQGKLKYDPDVAPDEQVGSIELQESGDSNLIKKSTHLFKAPCAHVFHIICVEGWLEKQRLCPMCKADIPENLE
jgi:RING-H2 zinc finger domain